jgi:hypothetical protein
MRAVAIVLIQVVLAALVAGLAMPALLVSVPQTREAGPMAVVILVVILFVVFRLVWPAAWSGSPGEGGSRRHEPPT